MWHNFILILKLTHRGAWQPTVHRVTKNQTQLKQLSTHARVCARAHTHTHTHAITEKMDGWLRKSASYETD